MQVHLKWQAKKKIKWQAIGGAAQAGKLGLPVWAHGLFHLVFLKCQASWASVTSLVWERSEILAPDVLSPKNWSFYKGFFITNDCFVVLCSN